MEVTPTDVPWSPPSRTHVASDVAVRIAIASKRMYDAEVALQDASQTGVDAWTATAANKLHDTIGQYLAAIQLSPSASSDLTE